MDNAHLMTLIWLGIGTIFSVAYYLLWRQYWSEAFGVDARIESDKLFVYALSENLLTHPAYLHVHELAEDCRKASRRISAGRVLLLLITMRVFGLKFPASYDDDWRETLRDLSSAAQKRQIQNVHNRLMFLTVGYIVRSSLILHAALKIVWPLALLAQIGEKHYAHGRSEVVNFIQKHLRYLDRRELAKIFPVSVIEAEAKYDGPSPLFAN